MIEKMFSKLKFYLDNDVRTVILEGEKGIGKTLVVQKLFDHKFGKGKWRYYSGSTMDPHIDFIGCPIKTLDKETNKEYLDLIQPKDFALDQVEAIFLDEWNRSKEPVRNACLELIQFGRMNGKEFKNLKFIWGAVNPDNGNYQVDAMDEAQRDRFIVYLKLPYEISESFFTEKYPEYAGPAIEWWKNLPADLKKLVSPRRLDYALEFFNKGGEIEDVIDDKTNPGKLIQALKSGSFIAKFNKLKEQYEKNKSHANIGKLNNFFNDPNNFFNIKDHIIKNNIDYTKFFNEEDLSNLLSSSDAIFDHIINNLDQDKFGKLTDTIVDSNLNSKLADKIKLNSKYVEYSFLKDEPIDPSATSLEDQLEQLQSKTDVYKFIEDNKHTLTGSDRVIQKMLSVNTTDYDINEDQLAHSIMMDGLDD